MHPTATLSLVRGGSKIILVSALTKGGIRGVNLTFARYPLKDLET